MPDPDQVETPAESSDDAGALGGEQDTQGEAAASSDTGTTTEAAEPTVEEQLAALKEKTEKLETDLGKSHDALRQQQSRADQAEAELAPFRAARQKELEAITKDDERFQKRIDEVGLTAAIRELNQADQALYRDQQANVQAAADWQKAWDKATVDTDKYAKDAGMSAEELNLLRTQYNNFPAANPEHSVELAKLAIDKAVGKQVTAKAQENMARNAEKEVRQKVANQPPAGAAGPGTETDTSTHPGEETLKGMEEAAKTIGADEL